MKGLVLVHFHSLYLNKLSNFNLIYELNIDGRPVNGIYKKIGGNVYLSGTQAATYQSVDTFLEQEISLIYQRFYDYQQKFPYNQGNSEFSNGVSILDLLFYYGPEGAKKYIKEYDEYSLRLQIDNLLNSKDL